MERSAAVALERGDLALASDFSTAESESERRLLAIWESVLNIRGLGIDDDFFEINGQSLTAVTLFTEIEHVFGRTPPVSTLLKYPTIRRLAARLDELIATERDNLVIPVRARGRLRPLFFSHAAHGNVLFVRKLLPHLHPERPVFAIQARGLQSGEAPHHDFGAMAVDYVAQLRRVQPEGPYFLAGNCVGSLIAFEMAQRLRSLGQEVGGLVMIDPEINPHAVPWLYWRRPDALHLRPWQFVLRLALAAQRRLSECRHRLSGRPWLRERFETGPDPQVQQALFVGLKAAMKAYRPRPYDGKLSIICAASRLKPLANPKTGWPSVARQVAFVEVGRSHYEVFNDALSLIGATIEEAFGSA